MKLITLAFLVLISPAAVAEEFDNLHLRYGTPAEQWNEALPVGNGRLGGMVFGGIGKERIQFNEDTLWTGIPHDYSNAGAYEYLPEIRRLLFEGKQREAEELAMRTFMSVPLRQERYQPFGDLWIEFHGAGEAADYRRTLDLDRAVAKVSYRKGEVTFTRSVYCSHPDQVLVVHLAADKPGQLDCTVSVTTPHEDSRVDAAGNTLVLSGRVSGYQHRRGVHHPSILEFESRVQVRKHNGSLAVEDGGFRISQADEVTLVLAAATSHVSYHDVSADPAARCEKTLASLKTPLLDRHVEDHRSLFRRVSLDLGVTDAVNKDTDTRVLEYREGGDPHLATLIFQFGRYLLIASSRPGTQPANLQGLWNELLSPPWESKYTTNINAEMNYWLAEPLNLSECHEPLFSMVEDCARTGRKVAKLHYDCRGWLIHHNTDLWRGAAPINASNHGIWPTGGAWLCQHLWLRYAFTLDEEFLKTRAYPVMKEAALFFVDYLVDDGNWLISGPSNSPENGGLVMGPAMDHQIIRNLFSNCIEASRVLEVDTGFRDQLEALRKRIAPNRIGKHGQLQEWLEDKDDPNNKHRHVSHLWSLHPGREIIEETPDLFAAARKSLEMRGDGGTGWSMAWKVNFWARFKDGDRAHLLLGNLLRLTGSSQTEYKGGGIYPNLFCAHPPFQIDGNLGVASGIGEMLLQSHRRNKDNNPILDLLPALPGAWPEGNVKGLCARGGFEAEMAWKGGRLTEIVLTSRCGGACEVRYGAKGLKIALDKGGRSGLTLRDFR